MEEEQTYRGPFAFFRKHFNGDYSLGRSYWVNTFLISQFAPLLGFLLLPRLAENLPARYGSIGVLSITAFGVLAWAWAISGTWASASKHVARGGKQGWATVAKVMIVLSIFRILGELINMSGSLGEHWKVATGWQLGPDVTFQVRADGKSILLAGGINDGTADALAKALNDAPSVTTVVLQSSGGWVRQGNLIAKVISARHLNTYVESECSSACTIAFLAGKDRTGDPKAHIGFHSFRSIGANSNLAHASDVASLQETYQHAGLARSFIDRVAATPYDKIWYPTNEELLAAGIFTRTSLGGETATVATVNSTREKLTAEFMKTPLFAAMASKYPTEFNQVIDKAWVKVQEKSPDSVVIAAAREQVGQLTSKLLPIVDDKTLLEFNLLVAAQATALSKRSSEACVELIFPTGDSNNLVALLPNELATREKDLTIQMIQTSDPNNALHISKEERKRIIQQALGPLPQSQLQFLVSAPMRLASPHEACDAVLAYMQALNSISIDERARSIRAIYTSD